ncbi:MAG: cytochrome ubiquinol oxidase subunit I, partial [Thermoanaerobaculia bacterium]
MNYPLWDLPASGLLIAVVAILHVFVSHFAVGGGLFLVVTEAKARRENDALLLDYVRRHSRFFILLTLVFGAVTGVGIWFTIGLVHPAATSSLISAFVWGWAIEWVLFLTEIAAAIVYYYGWDRLTAKQHLAVGWIYFAAAWGSLAVINGILAYMLTPGTWIETHAFWGGFFNPTYWPSLVIRTLGAMGLAGVYALFTASWLGSDELKAKLARWATMVWILPLAIGLPLSMLWYFAAADNAGVPVAEFFGTATAGAGDLLKSMFATATSGHPVAQRALRTAAASITLTLILAFAVAFIRRARFGRLITGLTMLSALFSIGASEWVREDLRKPFVIGSYMFVNQLRMPPPAGSAADRLARPDPLRIDQVQQAGVLSSAMWLRVKPETRASQEWTIEQEAEIGGEIFRVQCSQCHTRDGYLAIRPLVMGRNAGAIDGTIARLAAPRGRDGSPAEWSTPGVQLTT